MVVHIGQDVEPAGKYILVRPEQFKSENYPEYEVGEVTFHKPLIIYFGGGYREETNWKQILYRKYKKKGLSLSKALLKDGYDGIITLDHNNEPSEIVDLTILNN